jgi:hypothetical protein
MALFTQAFLRGARGVVADYAAIAQPWGFDVERIATPLIIFQEKDPNRMAARVGQPELVFESFYESHKLFERVITELSEIRAEYESPALLS